MLENENWTPLFNGYNIEDWTPKFAGHPLGTNYKNTFLIIDSLLVVNYSEYDTFAGEFGHLFFDKPFTDYKLRVTYRFYGNQIEGGPGWAFRNNGIMFHCQDPESMMLEQDFPISLEYQLLGGDGVNERTNANLCTPGTNIYMKEELIESHCINSNSKTYHGDDWVSADLVVYHDSIIYHILEGDTVLTYTKPHVGGGMKPENASIQDGTPLKSGYIAIQSETHPIAFKSIEILNLAQD